MFCCFCCQYWWVWRWKCHQFPPRRKKNTKCAGDAKLCWFWHHSVWWVIRFKTNIPQLIVFACVVGVQRAVWQRLVLILHQNIENLKISTSVQTPSVREIWIFFTRLNIRNKKEFQQASFLWTNGFILPKNLLFGSVSIPPLLCLICAAGALPPLLHSNMSPLHSKNKSSAN